MTGTKPCYYDTQDRVASHIAAHRDILVTGLCPCIMSPHSHFITMWNQQASHFTNELHSLRLTNETIRIDIFYLTRS